MRGKIGTPSIRRGADEPRGDGTAGIELDGGADDPGVTPGGGVGVMMNGERGSVLVVASADGVALAASDEGQGSVRNEPLVSARKPVRQRATTRKR
jgi:hypothetical protein